MYKLFRIVLSCAALVSVAYAADTTVEIRSTAESGVGEPLGSIHLKDTPYGLLITPKLTGLTAGLHGFHIHEHASCHAAPKDGKATPGQAAGDHLDPARTGKHLGPYADGHLGDLPPLYVAADGTASLPVLAPRLKLEQVRNRSLMIHAGGDNFSDEPAKLGGGGARVACGAIEAK